MNVQEFYQQLDQLFAQHDTERIKRYMIDSLEQARRESDTAAITAVGNELAGFYRVSGQIDEAITLSQEVLQNLKDMGQETSENFAAALQNAASILSIAGEKDTALAMYETAKRILEYQNLHQDYRMAALYNNISALYRELDRFDDAETAALQSLQIIITMPEYRIEMATSLINLGEVQTRLGKYEDAKGTLQASLDIYELETGNRDPHTAAAAAAMGNLYYYWKKPDDAIPYFEKAMNLIERDYGRNAFYEMMARNLETVKKEAGLI